MGFFGFGWTRTASAKKSAGRSASSGGDVRRIPRSDSLRRRARDARPRRGFSFLGEGFEVRLALTTIAQPGRDDSANHATGFGPICVDHGEREPLCQADGNDSRFPVVPALVLSLERGAFEQERRELEVKPADPQVVCALPAVPREAHALQFTRVYTIALPQDACRCGITDGRSAAAARVGYHAACWARTSVSPRPAAASCSGLLAGRPRRPDALEASDGDDIDGRV